MFPVGQAGGHLAAPAANMENIMTTLTLRTPAKLAGEEWPTLTFREPTGGEWEALDGLEGVAADIKAVSIASGLPEPAIAGLGVRDFRAASQAVALLVAASPVPSLDADPTNTFTIALREPIALGEQRADELKLREPTAKEWRGWEGRDGTAADLKAVETVTGLPDVLVRRIPVSELRRAAAWIGRFFSDAPATGAQS